MTIQEAAFDNDTDAPDSPEKAASYLASLMGGKADAAPADQGADAGNAVASAASEVKLPDTTAKAADPKELDASNAVISSRDGKYVIEYEKLVEAREGRAAAVARVAELEALLQERTANPPASAGAEAQTNADIASKAIEQGVSADVFGDFSEEAIAKGVETLVNARVDARLAAEREKADLEAAPLKAQQAKDAEANHFAIIFKAHPDADQVSESKELNSWIAAQPSFARTSYAQVLKTGTADEIVEMLDNFKAATHAPAASGVNARAAAKAVIQQAANAAPASLSDIPGGRAGGADRFEALDAMGPTEQLAALQRMSQDDRDKYMSR